MYIKRIILLYLFAIVIVIPYHPTVSFASIQTNEAITQYIVDLSKEIYGSIEAPDSHSLYNPRGEVKLKLLLSPWGELKDVSLYESSGNKELDNLCLKAAMKQERYQPFPEELGDQDHWIDVPIIFKANPVRENLRSSGASDVEAGDGWSGLAGAGKDLTPGGIEDAVDIAMENDMSTRIAMEGIELSRLKLREANRALYPSGSLNYMETTGKTTDKAQDFTDKEYKLKFEYPLYYGWRLRYAVSQAASNMKASRYNYDNVMRDLRGKVEEAFYSYLTKDANLGLQYSLLKDARAVFDIARKRFDLGLSTKSEFLQVESQLRQINYQVTSSENDLTMARLSLAQAMNIEDAGKLEDLLDIELDMADFKPVDIGVGMEECIGLAVRNRPDIKSKEYMVEFNEYGRMIEESKDQFKIDLTGSYGRSGGAFESESLSLGADWFLGVKLSRPLGGNTISTSYTKEETSEKHGQTTRTESLSKAVEIGLLDNIKSFSDRKSAEIELDKAREELKQTRRLIYKEVKESYLNYRKGLIQADTNFNKIRYREEELKVAKARAELNEIPLSELIRAYINLTDEKSYYIEAIGSLYQSLARLNKATGYTLLPDSETFRLANAD